MSSKEDGNPSKISTSWNSRKFGCVLALLQIAFVVLFAIVVEYDWDALPVSRRSLSSHERFDFPGNGLDVPKNASSMDPKSYVKETDWRMKEKYPLRDYYSMYGDIQVMIFCAFGLLIACFKKYGYSSVNIAFMLCCFVVQWSTLAHGFFNLHEGKIKFSLVTLVSGDFAVAAVLISTCVVLGTISPLQYLALAFIEVIFYCLNEWISLKVLKVVDVGGSSYLHVFAAYFGLSVSFALHRSRKDMIEETNKLKFGSKWNELLAMVGTFFLFIYWPSFNSIFAPADLQNRAVINTAVALLASCVGSFAASAVMSKDKFSMTVIQNGALAGGVAIGSVADLMIQPYAALLIGMCAGFITVIGFLFVNPFLEKKLKLVDICGVQFLHGFPGILGGLVSCAVCAIAAKDVYGSSFYAAFPAAAPVADSPDFVSLSQQYPSLEPGHNRSPVIQAVFQMITLVVSILLALVSGSLCGFILRLKIFDPLKPSEVLDDEHLWQIPKELTREEEDDIRATLEKLGKVLIRRDISHTNTIKDQLKGLEACLKP